MRSIRQILVKDWSLKLTAVILAFFLWLAVSGDRDVQRIITVPLEIRLPRLMEITNLRPSFVELVVRGAPMNIGSGQSSPLAYTIDMQGAPEGENIVTLSAENVRIPAGSGLEVIRVIPPRIALVLERTISKEVLIIPPPPEGKPADGIDIYRVVPSPLTVLVTGPRSHVEPIRELPTEAFSVEGKQESFHTFLNLIIEDDTLRTNPSGPIEVNVALGPHREPQTVAGIPVTPSENAFTVKPARISVRVLVPITFEEELTSESFTATVDVGSLEEEADSAKLKPEVGFIIPLDPAITIEQIIPAEVTVTRNRIR